MLKRGRKLFKRSFSSHKLPFFKNFEAGGLFFAVISALDSHNTFFKFLSHKKSPERDTYHKAGRCPLAFLLIGLDARMNCSKIKI